MKKLLILCSFILLIGIITGCSFDKKSNKEQVEEKPYKVIKEEVVELSKEEKLAQEAFAVINRNLENSTNENLDAYLSDLSAESITDEHKQLVQESFANFDLEYEITNIDSYQETEDKAYVIVEQKSKQVENGNNLGEFTDNIAIYVHTLIKENGQFKIFETTVIDAVELNNYAKIEVTKDKKKAIEQDVFEVIKRNVKNTQEENIEGYLSDVITFTTNDTESQESVQQLFDNYDLKIEVSDLKTFGVSENVAYVILKQKTVGINSAEGVSPYNDNIATITYKLVKENGQFKIMSSQIIDITPINEVE